MVLCQALLTAGFDSNCWPSLLLEPTRLSTTGKKSRPWNNPKSTTRKKILKKVRKMIDLDAKRRTKERKVEMPPLRTAGPVLIKVFFIRSLLDPSSTVKAWAMWAE